MNRFHVWLAGGIAVWTGCGSSSTPASPTTDGSDEVPTQADAASSTSTLEVLRRARIGSHNSAGWPNTDEASAEVDLGAGPFQRVTLVVDLESTCYPFDKWKANPPPPQQSWPADCDAFDRNLNVFIDNPLAVESDAGEKDGSSDAPIDVDDAGNSGAPIVQMVAGPPPYELVHAITPFGGPEHLETDITDFANGLPGKHHLRAHLLSWSDMAGQVTGSNNGWTISVTIHIARPCSARGARRHTPLRGRAAKRSSRTDGTLHRPFRDPKRAARISNERARPGEDRHRVHRPRRRVLPAHPARLRRPRHGENRRPLAGVRRTVHAGPLRPDGWRHRLLSRESLRQHEQRASAARELVPRKHDTSLRVERHRPPRSPRPAHVHVRCVDDTARRLLAGVRNLLRIRRSLKHSHSRHGASARTRESRR